MRTGNLGETRQRRKRRPGCAMRQYDHLPKPLRGWIAGAALPWSPVSCLKLWRKARAEGASDLECLARLDQAEARLLARESKTAH